MSCWLIECVECWTGRGGGPGTSGGLWPADVACSATSR